jgi:hypothetical protein
MDARVWSAKSYEWACGGSSTSPNTEKYESVQHSLPPVAGWLHGIGGWWEKLKNASLNNIWIIANPGLPTIVQNNLFSSPTPRRRPFPHTQHEELDDDETIYGSEEDKKTQCAVRKTDPVQRAQALLKLDN